MVGSVNESKPPAKATPLNADAAQRAAGRPVASAGAELESSEVLALPRSDAPPLAVGDRDLSKLRSTISSRETLVENARPRSHVAGRSASLATNMGSAKPCATACRRVVAADAAKAGTTLLAARKPELERIAAKERALASLEKLPTVRRAEDPLSWRELRTEPEYAARSVSGAPTTATRDARPASLGDERASLDNQVDWFAESKYAWREISTKLKPAVKPVGAPETAKSDAPSSLDKMLAKPIEKQAISPAEGLWQVCPR